MMLWKVTDYEGLPDEPRTIIKKLLDVIQCQYKAQAKTCSTESCRCHKQRLYCTAFCNCHAGHDCLNSFTTLREIAQSAEDTSETDGIDSNRLDYSDHCLEQDQVDGGGPDDPIRDYLDEWL